MVIINKMLSLKTTHEVARELAARIRTRRLNQGWTQAETAARAGLRLATYVHFERTGEIALRRLLKLFDILGLLEQFDAIGRQADLSTLRLEDLAPPLRQRGLRKRP